MAASKQQTIEMLQTAYSMEMETVINYLAYSVNLAGVRSVGEGEKACTLSKDLSARDCRGPDVVLS